MSNVDETISNLKFIGKVKDGEKISTSDMKVQNANSYLTMISRKIKGDTGEKTYLFIRSVVISSIDILNKYADTESECEEKICSLIKEDLSNSMKGISNLENTYKHDIMIVSKYQTLRQLIETRISKDS